MDAEHLVLWVALQCVMVSSRRRGLWFSLVLLPGECGFVCVAVAPSFRAASRRGLVLAQLERPVLCVSV